MKSLTTLFTTALYSSAILLTSNSVLAETQSTQKPTLNVYTYDSFSSEWGPGLKLKKGFEEQCNCTIKYVSFDDGVSMFNRLRLEGAKNKADVIIGLDNNLLKAAEKSKLFANNPNINLSVLTLPVKWNNQTFIPYDYGQYAFVYDKQKLKNPPTSLKQLVNDQKIKIIYQDPRTSTVGRGLLAWMNAVYPQDQVAQAWQTLAKHTVTVSKGWSASYEAFLKGEADMVLSYNTSPLYHMIYEHKNNYAAGLFSEGHITQIELAARLKSSKHPKLSQEFLAYLLTPQAQKAIALHNIMLPVIKTDINPEFNHFKQYKTLEIPYTDAKTAKKQIRVWQQALTK